MAGKGLWKGGLEIEIERDIKVEVKFDGRLNPNGMTKNDNCKKK